MEPEPWKSHPCPWPWNRRTYVCCTELGEEALELDDKDLLKSLYICTSEKGDVYRSYNVRAIELSHLCSSETNQLDEVAYEFGQHLPTFAGCGVFGSEIIFGGGSRIREYGSLERDCSKDLYAFDTDDRYYSPEAKKLKNTDDVHVKNPKPKPLKKMMASFRQGKHRPLLVELGGKLYSLSGKPIYEPAPANPAFEVFDPEEGIWSPLVEPPFLVLGEPDFKFTQFSYIVCGTKIFVSSREVFDPRLRKSFEKPFDCYVFCFDVAQLHRGWRKISNFFLAELERPFISTPFHGRALALDLDLYRGDLKLVLTYSFGRNGRNAIEVYLMSYSDEKAMYVSDLDLPNLPPEFDEPTEFNFVYLGGQKFGLVLSRFIQSSNRGNDNYTIYECGIQRMRVVVIPFRFTYSEDWLWRYRFNFKFLSTRFLEYYTKQDSSMHPEVLGCFVL